jgi:hypothetical protein
MISVTTASTHINLNWAKQKMYNFVAKIMTFKGHKTITTMLMLNNTM